MKHYMLQKSLKVFHQAFITKLNKKTINTDAVFETFIDYANEQLS